MSLSQLVTLVVLYVGSVRDIEEEDLDFQTREEKLDSLYDKFKSHLPAGLFTRTMEIVQGMWEYGYSDYFHDHDVYEYIRQGG